MKIVIGGDIIPTPNSEKYYLNKDVDYLFTDLMPIVKSADRAIFNLEGALTRSENRIKKFGPHLKGAPECADTMKMFGITDMALSNNHVFDFGIEGLDETLSALKGVGINYMGIGADENACRAPYYIEQDGIKIGFINVCEHEYSYATEDRVGCNPFDPFLTMHDIREAKKNSDYVVVIYHGGKEHCEYPSPRLMRLCHEMVECGANVVLTQHSHCIGCYEEYEGGHIVYGQGNFHFPHMGELPDNWYQGLLVELNITKGNLDFKVHPFILSGAQISLAKGSDYDTIMNAFYERNKTLKNGEWKKGWLEFCQVEKDNYDCDYAKYVQPVAPTPNEARRHVFSHFLDCEAHTDVLRELFVTWNKTNK